MLVACFRFVIGRPAEIAGLPLPLARQDVPFD